MKDSNLTKDFDDLKKIKSGGIINEFLWNFAGVNKSLLRQCPNEYSKYAGMGGTILCTAVMAMLSGAYAIYFVFENVYISIAFGIFWGILILNLDRYIVSTMYSDGKHSISWEEFRSAIPRLIIAIFIGVVIATPLEMKLFEERINIEIAEMESEIQVAQKSKIRLNYEDARIKKEKRIIEINDEINRLKRIAETSALNYTNEISGKNESGKPGEGKIAKGLITQYKRDSINHVKYEQEHSIELAKLKSELDLIEKNEAQDNNVVKSLAQQKGFCQRYEAFSRIDDNNIELSIVIWFIRLLFIIIEVLPTFLRMMIARGTYDDLLQAESIYISKMANRRSEEVEEEYETEIAICTERNRVRLEAETKANEELYNAIAQAQSEVIATAIEKWKKQELEKVEKDPCSYIKIN